MGGCCGNLLTLLAIQTSNAVYGFTYRENDSLGYATITETGAVNSPGNGSQNLHHFQNAAMSRMGGPPCFLAMINGYFYLKWGNENYLVLETGQSRKRAMVE